MRLCDKRGRILLDKAGQDGDRPEVDRAALRAMLLRALPADTVLRGRKVRAVRPACTAIAADAPVGTLRMMQARWL